MASWQINDSNIDSKISKIKSNHDLMKNYMLFVSDICNLRDEDDPSVLGDRKTGRYSKCYGRHLTRSHSLIFTINYELKIINLIAIGDHKELYGKDK